MTPTPSASSSPSSSASSASLASSDNLTTSGVESGIIARRDLVTAGTQLDSEFIRRWSPRSYENTPLSEADLKTLFEAARWAPSCFNDQPWEFRVAHTEEALKKFRPILVDGNRLWTDHVPVIAVLFARLHYAHNKKPNNWAVFDCGSAWVSLALEAQKLGLAAHGMAGYHEDVAYKVCDVSPETHKAVCVIAIGKPKGPEGLAPGLVAGEKPSSRKPLSEVVQFS